MHNVVPFDGADVLQKAQVAAAPLEMSGSLTLRVGHSQHAIQAVGQVEVPTSRLRTHVLRCQRGTFKYDSDSEQRAKKKASAGWPSASVWALGSMPRPRFSRSLTVGRSLQENGQLMTFRENG